MGMRTVGVRTVGARIEACLSQSSRSSPLTAGSNRGKPYIMTRPPQDPPLNTRVEIRATDPEVARWKEAAGDVSLAAWARRTLGEAAREIAFDEACPERVFVMGRCFGTERIGARVMLTPQWNVEGTDTARGHRSLDLFLAREQAEELVEDLQRILAEPWEPISERDHHHPAHPSWHPATNAPLIPGWARWPGRRDR